MMKSKKFTTLVLSAALTLVLSAPAFGNTMENKFEDTHANFAVEKLTELGVIHGDGHGSFRPLDTLTRAEWAQMLYNAFSPARVAPELSEGQPWWMPAVSWLDDVLLKEDGTRPAEASALFWGEHEHFDPNGSADIKFILMTAYAVTHPDNGRQYDDLVGLVEDPAAWAEAHNIGWGWRCLSRSSTYTAREDAANLLWQMVREAMPEPAPTAEATLYVRPDGTTYRVATITYGDDAPVHVDLDGDQILIIEDNTSAEEIDQPATAIEPMRVVLRDGTVISVAEK